MRSSIAQFANIEECSTAEAKTVIEGLRRSRE
jgi:hypothetical protein